MLDRRIFLKNFNGELTSQDLERELDLVASAIIRKNGKHNNYPTLNKKQIRRLEQVVWILKANNKE